LINVDRNALLRSRPRFLCKLIKIYARFAGVRSEDTRDSRRNKARAALYFPAQMKFMVAILSRADTDTKERSRRAKAGKNLYSASSNVMPDSPRYIDKQNVNAMCAGLYYKILIDIPRRLPELNKRNKFTESRNVRVTCSQLAREIGRDRSGLYGLEKERRRRPCTEREAIISSLEVL